MPPAAATIQRPRPATRTWRLSGPARKAVLLVHIAASGAWLGVDVVLGVLVVRALTADGTQAAVALASVGLFAVWSMVGTGVLSLVSGVVLGLGTKYGLVRYWWVAVKLVLNVALLSAVLFALRPGVTEIAAQAELTLTVGAPVPPVGDLVFPPVVSTIALLVAMTLSVFKPWGRIRRQRRP